LRGGMNNTNIEEMHNAHGAKPGTRCGDCCNFVVRRQRGKKYSKCRAYGYSSGKASDWRAGNEGCGMHNRPFDPATMRPLMGQTRLDGQMEF